MAEIFGQPGSSADTIVVRAGTGQELRNPKVIDKDDLVIHPSFSHGLKRLRQQRGDEWILTEIARGRRRFGVYSLPPTSTVKEWRLYFTTHPLVDD
jgi:hypothetical protein